MIRAVGVLLFLASVALPVHGCSRHPRDFEPGARARRVAAEKPVPPASERIAERVEAGWRRDGVRGALWDARAWYPYFLAPVWLAALALARRSARGERAAARGLLVVALGVAAFEACYLASDYDGFLPDAFQAVETLAAWAVVCLVLFGRPRGRADPVGSAVSAQALLGVLHALTFPVQDLRLWSADGHGLGAVAQALAANYRVGFWVAVAALSAAAAPGYLPFLATRRESPRRGLAGAAQGETGHVGVPEPAAE